MARSRPRATGRGVGRRTEGSRAGMEPELESSPSQRPPPPKSEVALAAGGDGVLRDLGPSSPPGGGGGRGGGGAEPAGPDRPARGPARGPGPRRRGALARLPPAAFAEPLGRTPRPGRSPSLPRCASPGPRLLTHSGVCLARERCPWLHNSPDGIRPRRVSESRSEKVRVLRGQQLAAPAFLRVKWRR